MAETDLDLEVVGPHARDAGRGVARLSEGVRRRLGVLSGDTVLVTGGHAAAAVVRPARRDLGDDAVRLDSRTRERAGAAIGDTVMVRAERIRDATRVAVTGDDVDDDAVTRALRDRVVEPGERFEIPDGTIEVAGIDPVAPARVTAGTAITFRSRRTPDPRGERRVAPIGFDDIGGLDDELDLVREAVELPLTEPELFARLGIEPPSGVLLYGPPGTGKTMIAQAVAAAVDATFIHISGPELTSKYKGETEQRLRETFERARDTAPSIVFFDEIDAIAGTREDGGDMEARVVAQLLGLLDGIEERGDVVVIGATNRIDAIDPALRRPGRFDREIEIGVPDEAGRGEILRSHAADVPIADDVDLDRLAARTHGFVGADIRALVTEAAMRSLRRIRRGEADAAAAVVNRDDFEAALAAVDPSAMREFVAERPDTTFEDIGGLDGAKTALREAIEWPLAYPRLFDQTGTSPPSGILLHGPPGTGKTLLARAVAGETEVNVIHIAGPELIDKYVGESERAVREVFERARQAAPSIVFFDEIDAIAGIRGGESAVGERVVSQLLTELDGLVENPNLVVLAATNRFEAVDPALLRPGRLETHIEVPLPDPEARRAILGVHTRETPLRDDVDLDAVAAALEGASGADVAGIVREASMRAIREVVEDRGPEAANETAGEIRVGRRHFSAAIERRAG